MPFRPTAPLLKKTSTSSKVWLARQYKDPYVRARLSDPLNYRSRSAFKLLEVENRYGFLKDFIKDATGVNTGTTNAKRLPQRTFNIVDLGAAPGGWSQVIAGKLGLSSEESRSSLPLSKQRGKLRSNMAQWKEEMHKRKKLDGMVDKLVDEEIDEMESFIEGKGENEWSAPPQVASSHSIGLSSSKEAEYDDMDPLDYLNSRDLDTPSTSLTPSKSLPINIVALDILPIHPISGVHTVQMDFLKPEAPATVIDLLAKLNGKAHARVDLLLSDLSPPHTGNRTADVSHSVTLLRAVWDFARQTLKTGTECHRQRVQADQWARQDATRTSTDEEVAGDHESSRKPIIRTGGLFRNGGMIVIKHFTHPISTSFCRTYLSPFFSKILYFKPPSSRSDSTEGYWVCLGWKGVPESVTLSELDEAMQRDVEREMLGEEETLESREEKKTEMPDSVEAAKQHKSRSSVKAGSGSHFILPPLFNMRELTGGMVKSADPKLPDQIIPSEARASSESPVLAKISLEYLEPSPTSHRDDVKHGL